MLAVSVGRTQLNDAGANSDFLMQTLKYNWFSL